MPNFEYRKSTFSDKVAECVEVATNIPTTIAIRDSKHPAGPNLRVTPRAWLAFRAALVSEGPVTRG
ncbi:protein of unknown function [Streptomyces sp. yr375]|uniref:DUF397 domain-containing protein n=1 Tax=Streptomyces sp. yr375 TaxID=1761906 RepID=UPI0008AEE2A6|nr:DUF397 domain-containing protein [Streptomyces sp. yr375]SES42315.1 protein of unknown function [Streptomyces sp. yr375]